MKIYLATDHKGFQLKEKIKKWLDDWGFVYEDCGALKLEPGDHYPDYVSKAAAAVSADPKSKAIVLGHSGQGEAIVANKFKGVRAVVFYGGPEDIIKLSREHNDANVLSIGATFVQETEMKKFLRVWLDTPFYEIERHKIRIQKITDIENKT